jgi:dienelactone hydrolase
MNSMRLRAISMALIFLLCSFWTSGTQASGKETAIAPELQHWDKKFRQAGASKEELSKFRDIARELQQMPGQLASFEDYLESMPPRAFVAILRNLLRNETEATPAQLFPEHEPAVSCESLVTVSIPDTTIDSAQSSASDNSCRIVGKVIHPPANNPITVFVALPITHWNGRFQGTGGGGYTGGSASNLVGPLKHGYAVSATDTGNPEGTASFALDASGKMAWNRLRDNAYGGIHDMTVIAKRLTQAFYGRAPRYAYFVGGSTGGRQALTEAQRYPDDYDGILALYPAIARDRYVPAQLWPQIVMHEANDFLSKEKLETATRAAVQACHGLYGVIEDPTSCDYDPAALVGTRVGGDVFTATDAKMVNAIWRGPIAHDESFLWWGPTRGTDLTLLAATTGTPLFGKPWDETLDWFRYFLVLDPHWDWANITRDRYELLFEQSIQIHGSTYGGDNPDLSSFGKRNGKLLIVHGWADQLVPAQETIAYYRAVADRMGGAETIANFVRLFLVPGADHGFTNEVPAPSTETMITALMAWVERGQPPAQLEAELVGQQNGVQTRRVLAPYR